MTAPRRGTPDFLLLFLTFSLVCFGLAFVFSASMTYRANDPGHLAVKQAIFAGVGTIVMFFCMNVDFRKFQKWVIPALFVVSGLLLLVPLVGKDKNGATSWLKFSGFSLQPTEFAKLLIIVYLASIISKKGDRFQDFKRGLMPPLVVIGFISALIMMQPDFGSTMVLLLCAMLIIIVGGAQLKHVFYLGAGGAVFMTMVGMIFYIATEGNSHHFTRFTAFWDPTKDPNGTGFQLLQSLYAFGHGGLTGAGFGQSVQKLHYLPEAHNDFIFAIIGEELGFIGTLLFLLVYLAFLWRGLIVALRCQDPFGMLLGVGIVGMIGVQAFVNMGGVTNTIPMTGVTLPLISYGGTSMLTTLAGLGILLSISREYNKPEKERETKKRA
ncbi:cell division protein FtsW [Paenibacillus tianmuensis]|uniref:Probable peptidoglycan glycosyltransferase FtsW n=1 Tax=Paenibacillus tianmuensis TaxID=624147 RepID=A0A1G4Q4C3_9BACL|nr:putative lipid II flippase FtsW [Paenibacillus tianmuensis]SCW39484.1 cell division protein FtsW [Paenibacillus tianmuensis]